MATIGTYTDKKTGTKTFYRILFVHPVDGRRATIWLGKVSKREAESIKVRVEALVTAKIHGHSPDDDTARWVAKISKPLARKLSSKGVRLIESRESAKIDPDTLLGAFLLRYIDKRQADTKASSRTVYQRTRKHLVKFFGAEKPLASITAGDAADFRRYLIGLKDDAGAPQLADNTIRRTCGFARQFFTDAVERKLITENPFSAKSIAVAVRGNSERFRFISREDTQKVLDACPDAQTRLVFALARFGGLRTPSETLALQWSDVDWSAKKMTVRAPKTEHHEGKGARVVPIFPELLPYLREAFDPDSVKVITIAGDATKNFRTRFTRYIERAGLTPWPKLFQNLRATRQTELEDSFPSHVVCAWLGNSQQVAKKHYLNVTEDHFGRATTDETSEKTAHKTAQQPSADRGEARQEIRPRNEKTPGNQGSFTKPRRFSKSGKTSKWTIEDSNL